MDEKQFAEYQIMECSKCHNKSIISYISFGTTHHQIIALICFNCIDLNNNPFLEHYPELKQNIEEWRKEWRKNKFND